MKKSLMLLCVLFSCFLMSACPVDEGKNSAEPPENPWISTLEEQMGTKEQVTNNGPSHFAVIKDPYKTVLFWNELGIGPWSLGSVGVPNPLRHVLHGKPVDLVIRVGNAHIGSMMIGLDYVLSSPGTYDDFIAKRGPRGRAFHLCFPVEDLLKAEAQMEALGYEPILIGHGWGPGMEDGGASFFETTENMGTVIEFVQPSKGFAPPQEGDMPPGGPMFPPGGDVGILEPLNLAIAVHDVEKAAAHFQVELGVGPWNILTLGPGNAVYNGEEVSVSVKVAVCNTGHLTLVLEQPLSSPSPIQDWLDQNGQGIHHVTFSVKDIESSAAKMKALGYDEFFKVPGMLSYFDTEDALGILVELSEPHTEAPEVN